MQHTREPPRDPKVRDFKPNPTGIHNEQQCVEFITDIVNASKRMVKNGGEKAQSPVRRILRNAINSFWECREMHMFDPRRPRSVKAQQDPLNTTYEHAVPINVVCDKLLYPLNESGERDEVALVLKKWVLPVVIHTSEDEELNRLGLKQRMPPGKESDPFSRYKEASISVPGLFES